MLNRCQAWGRGWGGQGWPGRAGATHSCGTWPPAPGRADPVGASTHPCAMLGNASALRPSEGGLLLDAARLGSPHSPASSHAPPQSVRNNQEHPLTGRPWPTCWCSTAGRELMNSRTSTTTRLGSRRPPRPPPRRVSALAAAPSSSASSWWVAGSRRAGSTCAARGGKGKERCCGARQPAEAQSAGHQRALLHLCHDPGMSVRAFALREQRRLQAGVVWLQAGPTCSRPAAMGRIMTSLFRMRDSKTCRGWGGTRLVRSQMRQRQPCQPSTASKCLQVLALALQVLALAFVPCPCTPLALLRDQQLATAFHRIRCCAPPPPAHPHLALPLHRQLVPVHLEGVVVAQQVDAQRPARPGGGGGGGGGGQACSTSWAAMPLHATRRQQLLCSTHVQGGRGVQKKRRSDPGSKDRRQHALVPSRSRQGAPA